METGKTNIVVAAANPIKLSDVNVAKRDATKMKSNEEPAAEGRARKAAWSTGSGNLHDHHVATHETTTVTQSN